MKRVITEEWLDRLPAADHRAQRSRGDLRRINVCMGHLGILCRLWKAALGKSQVERVVDLGAGDGTFCLRLVRRVQASRSIPCAVLVDRMPSVDTKTIEAFAAMGCRAQVVEADVLEWLQSSPPATVMFANLFLHHFREDQIAAMFRRVARCASAFLAMEPRRSRLSLASSHLLGFLGCNDVTRHDAVASVHAGFSGDELGGLWPHASDWRIEERGAGLFSHSLMVCRKSGSSGSLCRPA